ncbi:threonine aldolase family protein [Butyrivibrio sp. MC2013]|uniref:threonine aldolase family protein n=1 Tax=Butyrivibrio sp. MC2013 TaxID=1280686 RepID=UPI00042A2F6D|nr:aminotransferase class I/II-fold pyridoxal phosphate-dependent enzyme [Butyrivibrio sp. MC2013]
MEKEKLHFTSDYMEGAHPKVLEAVVKTNMVSVQGYGEDPFCQSAKDKILKACECPGGEVYFLSGGTQTNQTVIDCVLRKYQGVIAADTGHIAVHEAGAIEYAGHKVLTVPSKDGKLTAAQVEKLSKDYYDDANHEHMIMPGMVYISQPTEYGTLYSLSELKELRAVCDKYDIALYLDGARLAYALASSANDVTLPDIARYCDVFYIGGTKCGCLNGEAVVIPKKGFIPHFFTMIKQHGALLAKGRLLGVQFDALFTDGLYDEIGRAAIESAEAITAALKDNGYHIYIDSPTNQVFFVINNDKMAELSEYAEYGYMEKYDENSSIIRFCPSWAVTKEQTAALCELIKKFA